MNELKGFYSDQFGAIRAVNIDGEPWFNATDITTALGYRNSRDAIAKHVAREDARLFLKSQIATLEDFPNRGLTFINESGLYALIFGSKLESAKQFKRWVTAEVLPAIRKTGGYQQTAPQGKELLALAVLEAQKTIEEQNRTIERMRPKEIFADAGTRLSDPEGRSQLQHADAEEHGSRRYGDQGVNHHPAERKCSDQPNPESDRERAKIFCQQNSRRDGIAMMAMLRKSAAEN